MVQRGLRFKLILSLFLVLAVLTASYGVYRVYSERTRVEANLTEKGMGLALAGARTIESIISSDLQTGIIQREQLFQRQYRQFAEENGVKKFHTVYDDYAEQHWQKVFDAFLTDEDIVYALAVDDRGYAPTHNSKYQQRAKRIFNDPVGLAAAQTEKALKQVYHRDTGEVIWDFSYPIYVDGQKWGAFRVGVSVARAEEKIAAVRNNVTLLMLLMIALILCAVWVTTNLILKRPLDAILAAVAELAQGRGDLTRRLKIERQDELGILAGYINSMLAQLQEMLRQIYAGGEQVNQQSQLLVNVVEDNSQSIAKVKERTEKLKQAIQQQQQQTTASLQLLVQLAQTVEEVSAGSQNQLRQVEADGLLLRNVAEGMEKAARAAEKVNAESIKAREAAQEGARAVQTTITGMEAIQEAVTATARTIHSLGEQSEQISTIVQMIDDIAEQTNLLALNAAIEAARAGEQGKGFAVVADEVRKLAERSSRATKEINQLVSRIQAGVNEAIAAMENGLSQVSKGVELAEGAGQVLTAIDQAVEEVAEQISSISAIIEEVTASTNEVVGAMQNMTNIAQRNELASREIVQIGDQSRQAMEEIARLAGESSGHSIELDREMEQMRAATQLVAASAEELLQVAEELKQQISQFKTE
ncbi:methyl-accepting chemotaxis protein [Carboxydocella sp. ULO1]|uniref:methyl-accepting chemotaxis protein n=1 Tax=Carboxydocella sp. ULO1 TaxID=1926599 RepID=UPI0009AE5903|nr:HAMP domain-containing methyl-accepting chemotaxis protein [Carboxydocella sp. ULO1]GAW27761.1 methyl-accepting chemotaxis sensory transducer [Carboxydocella sp. ULO1]